jgi:hypothetical protein
MRLILIGGLAMCAAYSQAHASETSGGPAEIISCPAKGQSTRSFDFSTGSTAPWVVTGPDIPNGQARATPIDEANIPQNWKARIAGARWVQALPSNTVQPHALDSFVFTLNFLVKKGKRMPRLALTGQVIADEMFELNLLEPVGPNQHISTGISMGDDSPGTVEQGDMQDVDLHNSGDPKSKYLGNRAGTYVVQIVAQNNEGKASEVGVLARLKLEVKCGGK